MSVEKKFVAEGISKALVNEYLAEELERAGYGGMVMNRTPMGTQITVYAEKPGMVIGKGGKLIRKITRDLDRRFHLDNPQIDVQDVGRGDLNGRVVANRLASSLERGWYFRKAGQSMMRRVMDAGALGCEIVISGKLTGPRSRTEKFISGYIKHSGKPAVDLVDRGYSVAVKKLGVIGCQVRIIPPDVRLPDDFRMQQPARRRPRRRRKRRRRRHRSQSQRQSQQQRLLRRRRATWISFWSLSRRLRPSQLRWTRLKSRAWPRKLLCLSRRRMPSPPPGKSELYGYLQD